MRCSPAPRSNPDMQKILVIDDEEVFRQATACALQRRGFETHEAGNGAAGARLAHQLLPDLIICDINMGEMDGFTLLETLRHDPATAAIPFILMTGLGDASSMRRGMNLGADDYLPKPFTAPQLFSAVEARLRKREALRKNAEKQLTALRTNLALALPHEMITPLNGIFGLAQILSTDADSLGPEEVADFGRSILESAERLHRTVQNFLLYSQLEIQATDPASITRLRAAQTANVQTPLEARARHLAEKWKRTPDLQLELGDGSVAMAQDLFTKLIDEVLDNAFKFSAAGSAVRITSRVDPAGYEICVTDQGHGMEPKQIANIGAYAQFDRETHEQQGSGLGLAIVQRIIELHGGQFGVQSQPGTGTTVRLQIPVIPVIPVIPAAPAAAVG